MTCPAAIPTVLAPIALLAWSAALSADATRMNSPPALETVVAASRLSSTRHAFEPELPKYVPNLRHLSKNSEQASEDDKMGGDASMGKPRSHPIVDLFGIQLRVNYDRRHGPSDSRVFKPNVQPVVSGHLSEDGNLITRTIVPFIDIESPKPFCRADAPPFPAAQHATDKHAGARVECRRVGAARPRKSEGRNMPILFGSIGVNHEENHEPAPVGPISIAAVVIRY